MTTPPITGVLLGIWSIALPLRKIPLVARPCIHEQSHKGVVVGVVVATAIVAVGIGGAFNVNGSMGTTV